MKSIENHTTYTWTIKKSKFITDLIPCNHIEDVELYIEEIKETYPDASHHCVAYIVENHEKANDDGEPSGTAGLPMLNVISKQGLSNILVIVTRYFGGIKLGAGGLTRAYTQSVADALKEAEIVEKELVPVYDVTIDYTFTKKFEHMLNTMNIHCLDKNYLDRVTYTIEVKDLSFFDQVQNLTSNQYKKEFIREEYVKR